MTRRGQRSQAAARAVQSMRARAGKTPRLRRRAPADFAAARESAAKTPGREPRTVEPHEKQAIWGFIGRAGPGACGISGVNDSPVDQVRALFAFARTN